MQFYNLKSENSYLKKENRRLHELCKEKDKFFIELMSDALKHGSNLASKHMKDRKDYLKGK